MEEFFDGWKLLRAGSFEFCEPVFECLFCADTVFEYGTDVGFGFKVGEFFLEEGFRVEFWYFGICGYFGHFWNAEVFAQYVFEELA